MEGKRFDQLARALTTSSSRRRVLVGLLAGAVGGLSVHATAAQDGVVIADASGGDDNQATVVEPANATNGGNDRDGDHGGDREKNECKDASCPRNPNEDPPEPGFCCPDGSCSCGGGCSCPDCWVEELDKDPIGEPLPPKDIVIVREFCCFKCGGGREACCSSCDASGACVTGPDTGPIRGGSIRRR